MEKQLELPIQEPGIIDRLSHRDKALLISELAHSMIAYIKDTDQIGGDEDGCSQA